MNRSHPIRLRPEARVDFSAIAEPRTALALLIEIERIQGRKPVTLREALGEIYIGTARP